MKASVVRVALFVVISGFLWISSPAQQQQQPQQRTNQRRGNNNQVKLPEDPRLLELHGQLVRDAQKLATEYTRSKQNDKARAVLEEILRFVPTYAPASSALQKIHGAELTATIKTFEVVANKGWQDTGIDVMDGRPVALRTNSGKWHLVMDYPVSADGIEIPKEFRKFNLGALIGKIIPAETGTAEPTAAADAPAKPADGEAAPAANGDNAAPAEPAEGEKKEGESAEPQSKEPKPFFVGSKLEMIAPFSGRLFLRMYDGDPSDNSGKLLVTISGTFGPAPASGAAAKEPFSTGRDKEAKE